MKKREDLGHNKARLLRETFDSKPVLRIAGAHNALGAKLIEKNGFDGVWASGLEISTAHMVPDANILTMTENFQAASAMNEATCLPVLCDCDTGYGNASNVIHMIKKYEAAGLAGVVIEDKRFPKVNSFVPGRQELEPMAEFMGKIEAAKNAQRSPDLMVFARVEALIAGWGMDEALRRAHAYAEAGADGIVIHSKGSTPDEIYAFASRWKGKVPLVAIPTTYYDVTAEELGRRGFRLVIYANQGLRAAMRAMDETFNSIHATGSAACIEPKIATMAEVFEIQGMRGISEDEKKYSRKEPFSAVIPAAGDHLGQSDLAPLLADKPLCMLSISGKTMIDRQVDLLTSCGVNDVTVVGGYRHHSIKTGAGRVLFDPDYASHRSAYSVMLAAEHMRTKTIVVYADILFDRQILERLGSSPHALTVVIDRAYQTLPFRAKKVDLVEVVPDSANGASGRRLELDHIKRLKNIGQDIDARAAKHEFIGMCFLREDGIAALKAAWADALELFRNKPFYEAPSAEKADFIDLLRYVIDRGVPVHGMEIERGWSEIHSLDDYDRVNAYYQKMSTVEAGKI